jgi:DinB superfamily
MSTSHERRKTLESFGRSPALLSAALREFPRKMWLYKSSADRWSIHEIILHLADSEAGAYILCRHFIAEPGSAPKEFDPARWADTLGYFHQSTREALEIIRRLRRMTYQLLVTVPDSVWSHTIVQCKSGEIALERWVELQEQHIPHHVAQMRDNYDAWLKRNPPRKSPSTAPGPHSFSMSAC